MLVEMPEHSTIIRDSLNLMRKLELLCDLIIRVSQNYYAELRFKARLLIVDISQAKW